MPEYKPPVTPTAPALDSHLRDSLAQLSTRGYLSTDVTLTGAQVQIGQRLTKTWAVGGWAGLTWDGNKEAGVRLKGSW